MHSRRCTQCDRLINPLWMPFHKRGREHKRQYEIWRRNYRTL